MNKTKLILYLAAIVIIIAALFYVMSKWRFWLSEVITWIVIIGVSFLAGWLLGRFGGKKNEPKPDTDAK
ncbi:MAG: hypothetical protein J6K28_04805 [Alistipes sp.]|nr:hypothetical protein [Alistipes sp.]